MKNEETKQNRTTLLILLALSHGDMHGYEISKFIEAKSKGFFNMPFGSLYPVLHRLESEKLITAKWDNSSAKPKKTYALSNNGKKALAAEVDTFRSYTKAVGLLISHGV